MDLERISLTAPGFVWRMLALPVISVSCLVCNSDACLLTVHSILFIELRSLYTMSGLDHSRSSLAHGSGQRVIYHLYG